MRHRTAEETYYPDRGVLCSAGLERLSAPTGGVLPAGNLALSAHHRGHCHRRSHWLAGLQALPRFGKMVRETIKRSGLMTKHQIEHICWLEVSWQRPFDLEDAREALAHLSALSPRGAVPLKSWNQPGCASTMKRRTRTKSTALMCRGTFLFSGCR